MSRRFFVHHAGTYVEVLEGRAIYVGRASSCDLSLDDSSVSRRHARFERLGDRCFVTDENSRNGVLLNGSKVQRRAQIHHGDVAIVGGEHLSFHARTHAPRSVSKLAAIREEDKPMETTAKGADPLSIFAEGAASALRNDELFVAEVSARNLLRSLKALAARGRPAADSLGHRAVELALTLAERTGSSSWLDEANAVTRAMRLELPGGVLQRGRALRLRIA